jgi:hypothetical protein
MPDTSGETDMYMNRLVVTAALAAMAAITPALVNAQGRGGGPFTAWAAQSFEILNVEPENIPPITNAPFTAEATTEFTQTLSDGNRIERKYTTSLARDGRGRSRREQDVAILNPVVVFQGIEMRTRVGTAGGGRGAQTMTWTAGAPVAQGDTPRLVVISDPVEGVTYTLDEARKEARRNHAFTYPPYAATSVEIKKLEAAKTGPTETVVEQLGTRQIEGVAAEGVRSTTTIPAGEIGNLNPIQLVTERWFSKELQMAVLITRKDPRSGDTTYRLANVVRAEPPPDLFTVPADYRVVDTNRIREDDLKREIEKIRKAVETQQR